MSEDVVRGLLCGEILTILNSVRVVLDTNVFIDGAADEYSPQAKLLQAVREGEIEVISTPAIEREYQLIIPNRVTDAAYLEQVQAVMASMIKVRGQAVDVLLDDEQDMKFFEAAQGGGADAIVTSDRHLLDVGEFESVRVLTPVECWTALEDERGGTEQWSEWVKGLGIEDE